MKVALFVLAILPLIISTSVPNTAVPTSKASAGEDAYADSIKKVRKESLGKPDPKTGEAVAKWTPKSGVNPEELGSYLEGDILSVQTNQGRNGIINTQFRWPGATIYYVIQGNFNSYQYELIMQAMRSISASTCVRFRQRTNQRDFVIIKSDNTGCWSSVGRLGGYQYLNLQIPNCVHEVGTPIHELLHAIGFFHEQSRLDRDYYVDIFWQNIQSNQRFNFDKFDSTAFGVGYDYNSVMHYSEYAFSANGRPTLRGKYGAIGQRNRLSRNDIAKINAMYRCY